MPALLPPCDPPRSYAHLCAPACACLRLPAPACACPRLRLPSPAPAFACPRPPQAYIEAKAAVLISTGCGVMHGSGRTVQSTKFAFADPDDPATVHVCSSGCHPRVCTRRGRVLGAHFENGPIAAGLPVLILNGEVVEG